MGYESLLIPPSQEKLVQITTRKAPSKKLSNRGCEFCPSNHKKGINKIFTKVRGRSIMIVGMAPGREENREEKNFVGDSGKFLWAELLKVGIKRSDVDTQNVVRCFPANKEDGDLIMRDPSKEELHCCSKYTEKAIGKSEAQVYVVLGEKAGKQLLGKEYKKTRKVFWSEKLKAKVYCLYHPSYFVRNVHPVAAIQEFRKNLEAVAQDVKGKGASSLTRYAYLEKQQYEAITTVKGARKARKQIKRAATHGIRCAVDLEDDVINGVRQDLCVGFSYKPGTAKVFITGHPKVKKIDGVWHGLPRRVVSKIRAIAKSIIEDASIEKVLHHGSYDTPQFWQVMGARIKGFDYDTEFASYLSDPNRHSYGLNALAGAWYPQFGEYKYIIMPEAFPKKVSEEMLKQYSVKMDNIQSMYNFVKKTGSMRLSQLPLKKLVMYNGVDCDITKRIEIKTKKRVHLPLVKIYKDASFILAKMEPNGPAFDFEHWAKLKKLYPPKLEIVFDKIKQIAGPKCTIKVINKKTGEKEKKVLWDISEGKDFNPSSPPQVHALIYKKLELARDTKLDNKGKTVKAGTGKGVLEILQLKHPIARFLMEYRRLSKMVSTYLNSYEVCAKMNGGLLRTTWWLTGTRTGRMSSGGGRGDEKGNTKVINLQNIHGDENLKNQIVADAGWRKLYVAIRKAVRRSIGTEILEDIDDVNKYLARLPSYGAKDKKKKLEGKLGDLQKKLTDKLSKSLRFKRLSKKILAGALGLTLVMLGFDQGQVEVRVMAQASGDKNLIKDCKSSDIHSLVGHAMTGWSVDKIKNDKKVRTLTKNIHFGILFGLGVNGLYNFIKAKDPETELTKERVQELYDNYFRRYPGVRKFINKMRAFVEANGYVENMFGFVRPLNTHASSNVSEFDDADEGDSGGAFWGNQAVNTPIQGAAHCLMFMAMAIMKRKAKKYKKLVPTLEVHDYMGFKCPIRNIFKMFALGKNLLEKEPLKLVKKEYPEIKWKIPLAVDGQVGLRYGDSVEADGKKMHEVLAEMFCETYTKESKLDQDLKIAA